MRKFWFAFGLLGAFMLGCAASAFVVPPVRAGTNPQRWEYSCLQAGVLFGSISDSNMQKFQEMGRQGWELATVDGNGSYYCFKRPL